MPQIRLKWAAVVAVSIVATIGLAYILGVQAGNLINSRNKGNYLQTREFQTKAILEKMENLAVGDTLANHAFFGLDLNLVSLSKLIKRKAVLSFADPGCGACLSQLEELQGAVTDSADYRYFILISFTTPLLLKEYKETYELGSRILYDENEEWKNSLGIKIAPFNLIVNSSLVIERVIAGQMTAKDFEDIIELNQHASKFEDDGNYER
jgi:peroxiredoxin